MQIPEELLLLIQHNPDKMSALKLKKRLELLLNLRQEYTKNPSENGLKLTLLVDILVASTRIRLLDLNPLEAESLRLMIEEVRTEFFDE